MTLSLTAGRALAALAAIALLAAAAIATSGGFSLSIGRVRLSAHRVWWPAVLGVAGGIAAAAIGPTGWMAVDSTRLWRQRAGAARWLVVACALLVAVLGLAFGTFAAAGPDAYGYVSQASLWARGQIREPLGPLALAAPWPDADWTFSPLGYRPAMASRAIVPTYPPGLPLVMSVFVAAGGSSAAYLVVPLLGALAVWATFVIGRQMSDPAVGAVAALLLASSPIFLFQLMLPMSDVPVMARWLAAIALATSPRRGAALAAGVAASLAIVTRPNLAPVALILLAAIGLRPVRSASEPRGGRRAILFTAGLAPGLIAAGAIHTVLYGSPVQSGYGSTRDLFSVAHVLPNMDRYGRWLAETEAPVAAATVVAALLMLARRLPARRAADPARPPAPTAWTVVVSVAVAAAVVAAYLVYTPFDNWTYLRFLLPALALALALAAAVWFAGLERLPAAMRLPLLLLACTVVCSYRVATAADLGVFLVASQERRYINTARHAATVMPSRALVLSVLHSGSLRHYTGRLTLRWDWLDPAWLDRAITFAADRGYRPYLLLEPSEEEDFRTRFESASAIGRLDWPPIAEYGRPVRVRLYDPADRARYFAGEDVRTMRVF